MLDFYTWLIHWMPFGVAFKYWLWSILQTADNIGRGTPSSIWTVTDLGVEDYAENE